VGGADLSYLYYDGIMRHLLFAHATGFLPWLWHPIIEGFTPEYSVWAPYVCNYRSCEPEKGGLSWNVIAEDISTFCRAQKIESPVLVGHSMGATVLTIAAAAYGLKPRGMVLIEPIYLPEEFYKTKISLQDHPLASKSIKRVNAWQNEDDAMSYLKSRTFFSDWDREILDLYMKYGMEKLPEGSMRLTCAPESEAAMFMGGWSRDPWPLLPQISCPVLLIEGEKSSNIGLVDIRRAVSMLPKGQYGSVADAGHLIPMQKPAETASLIRKFIQTLA
jgi:pimeloyl-ACP methyl ester carboxylesterase